MQSRKLLSRLMLGVGCFLFIAASAVKNNADRGANASLKSFRPGKPWVDTDGNLINAHGGGIIYDHNKYYWFGEKRGAHASEGVNVYSSHDLYNWKYEGVALTPVKGDPEHDISEGCKMERPKVLFNKKTGKYVMWFHLELNGKGYSAARAAVAVSDNVTGPYTYLKSFRPNGNMSRDMTLFEDEDGSAYHIYASRENFDLRMAKLTADYTDVTTQDSLLFSEHREAPAIFRRAGKYYLITSACTGWKPNAASLHVSSSIWGPWTKLDNPMQGANAELTFDGQSTFILPVQGKADSFIFMGDRWKPENLIESAYLWLPVMFENDNVAVVWSDEWNLGIFK